MIHVNNQQFLIKKDVIFTIFAIMLKTEFTECHLSMLKYNIPPISYRNSKIPMFQNIAVNAEWLIDRAYLDTEKYIDVNKNDIAINPYK
jgi:hypothetical protein